MAVRTFGLKARPPLPTATVCRAGPDDAVVVGAATEDFEALLEVPPPPPPPPYCARARGNAERMTGSRENCIMALRLGFQVDDSKAESMN